MHQTHLLVRESARAAISDLHVFHVTWHSWVIRGLLSYLHANSLDHFDIGMMVRQKGALRLSFTSYLIKASKFQLKAPMRRWCGLRMQSQTCWNVFCPMDCSMDVGTKIQCLRPVYGISSLFVTHTTKQPPAAKLTHVSVLLLASPS